MAVSEINTILLSIKRDLNGTLQAVREEDTKAQLMIHIGGHMVDIDKALVLTAALSDQVAVPNPAAQFVMWAMLDGSWQGNNIDGGAAQDKAVELGLIVETIFDPAVHGDSCDCEPGDQWYVPSERLLAMLPASPAEPSPVPASTPVRSS